MAKIFPAQSGTKIVVGPTVGVAETSTPVVKNHLGPREPTFAAPRYDSAGWLRQFVAPCPATGHSTIWAEVKVTKAKKRTKARENRSIRRITIANLSSRLVDSRRRVHRGQPVRHAGLLT